MQTSNIHWMNSDVLPKHMFIHLDKYSDHMQRLKYLIRQALFFNTGFLFSYIPRVTACLGITKLCKNPLSCKYCSIVWTYDDCWGTSCWNFLSFTNHFLARPSLCPCHFMQPKFCNSEMIFKNISTCCFRLKSFFFLKLIQELIQKSNLKHIFL